MMNDITKMFNEALTKFMCDCLKPLEEYCECIVDFTKYGVDDITVVEQLGVDGLVKYVMVVCPKECVIDKLGIVNPEYFIGIELEYGDEFIVRGKVIFEVPDDVNGWWK